MSSALVENEDDDDDNDRKIDSHKTVTINAVITVATALEREEIIMSQLCERP